MRSPLTYAGVWLFPLLAALGLLWGGWWTVSVLVVIWVALPALELILPTRPQDPPVTPRLAFDLNLYALVLSQIALIAFMSVRITALGPWEAIGAVASVGMCCGAIGINVGHELGHRRTSRDRTMAKLSLLTSLYMHFFIEHNRGHHARVATPEDPASARRGEVLYAFWLRSIVGSWRSAWRMARPEMLRYLVIEVAAVAAIAVLAGPMAAVAFVVAAFIGVLLLETVNYIEHYGLSRAPTSRGYEKVLPQHSWNAENPLGRALLFDLTRHSDHHAHPHRPYPALRHFPEAPQLPTGYPGMILLATAPPLFFRVMHPLLDS